MNTYDDYASSVSSGCKRGEREGEGVGLPYFNIEDFGCTEPVLRRARILDYEKTLSAERDEPVSDLPSLRAGTEGGDGVAQGDPQPDGGSGRMDSSEGEPQGNYWFSIYGCSEEELMEWANSFDF